MSTEGTKPAEFQRDIRLGLVLYGGVSLAIYMNGTTNELFRAVRGRGVYFLLKHLLNADITVDVASGASAGGINGIFLAFALANEREFGTCADLWRRDGDLNTLLNRLDQDIVPSVLDSDHYRDLLENGFRQMWLTPVTHHEPEAPSETRELDLFVAATDFYGRITNQVDATGRVIETKQHRSVFLLKHRQRNVAKCQLDPRRDAFGRWPNEKPQAPPSNTRTAVSSEPATPSSPDVGLAAFAKLAQITSCFPGAFAPVYFQGQEKSDGSLASDVDLRLKVWGKLGLGERYFVDGGVLDNKPFTTTLDTIFHRPAHRRVCRHLFYLEPDPERFSADKRGKPKAPLVAPSFLSTVLDAVTRLPAYESIADDLARVSEHNSALQRFSELVDTLARNGVSVLPGQPSSNTPHSSQGAADEGHSSRARDHQVPPRPASATHSSREQAYRTARLLGVAQRVTEKIAEALDGRHLPQAWTELMAGLRTSIVPDAITPTSAYDLDVLLAQVDVDYYIRRALALAYYLEPRSDDPLYSALWKNVNNELEHLEIIGSAIEAVVVPQSLLNAKTVAELRALPPLEVWNEILGRTLTLLDYRGLEECLRDEPSYAAFGSAQQEVLQTKDYRREQFRQELQIRLRGITEGTIAVDVAAPASIKTVLQASGARFRSLINNSGCDLNNFLHRFEREDRLRFPLELAGGVRQRDKISVVRLSPVDAQTGLSERSLENKICGETFGHFGAFLKKSWRSNDLLWGRLDGIARLLETLLQHTRFSTTDGCPSLLPELDTQALLRALGAPSDRRAKLGALFPHLQTRIAQSKQPNDPLSDLLVLLENLDGKSASARALLLAALTEVAQLDALCEDLPKVVADAAQEQLEWGQIKTAGQAGAPPVASDDGRVRKLVDRVWSATSSMWSNPDAQRLKREADEALADAQNARAVALKEEKAACIAEKKARRARERAQRAAARAEKRDPATLAFSPANWQFKATAGTLDAGLVNLATRVFAHNALQAMSSAELSDYFKKQYAVGNESATGAMPPTVLVDLGARAAVLTERALVASGKLGHTLRDNQVYKNLVRHPLRLIAGLVAFVRRAPTARIAIVLGSLAYTLLAIVTNVVFAGNLYAQDGIQRTIATWIFGILPLCSLAVSWAVWRSAVWKRVFVLLCFVVLVVGINVVYGACVRGWVKDKIALICNR